MNNHSDATLDPFDVEGQEAAEAAEQEQAPPATDPPEAAEPTTELVQEVEVTDEGATATEEAPAPEADANPDDLTDIVGPDGKYMTFREAAKATRSLQSMYDKKFEEQSQHLKEIQQANEQWNQWYQQQAKEQAEYEAYQQQVQQATPSSQEELVYKIDTDPMGTFRTALQFTPELVPTIVSYVRETKGNHLADTMMTEQQQYASYVQSQQWEYQNQVAQSQANLGNNINTAIKAVRDHYGEEFDGFENDVSEALGSGNYQIDFNNPASIAGAVENAYLRLSRAKALEAAQQSANGPKEVSPQAEAGSVGQAPEVTEDDQIRQEILDVQTSPWG